MKYPGFVLAYHGCDRAVGERILSGADHVLPSENKHDWLGSGAYFWENSAERALSWAHFLSQNRRYARTRINEPFVIGAIIEPGSCLDLTEARSLAVLRDAYQRFAHIIAEAGAPLPRNEKGHAGDEDLVKRYLDCAVFDFLHETRRKQDLPAFDTVRGVFFEGKPLYPGGRVTEKTHIQWCVRDPRLFPASTRLGRLRPDLDVAATAAVIMTYAQGLWRMAMVDFDRASFERQIELFLSSLGF